MGNGLKSLSEVEIGLLLFPPPCSQSFNCRKYLYWSRKIALGKFDYLLVCHAFGIHPGFQEGMLYDLFKDSGEDDMPLVLLVCAFAFLRDACNMSHFPGHL